MRDVRAVLRVSFGAVVLLTVVSVVLPFAIGGGAQPLLDRHSDPAPQVLTPVVAVVAGTKLYHDPRCRFIHGTPVLEGAATAAAQGYSPCPRCLGALAARPLSLSP